jgi:hypothetical protein
MGSLQRAALVAFLLSTPGTLLACECAGPDFLVSGLERSEGRNADVFLGRVVRALSPREVEVEVLESFSGTGGLKRLQSRDTSSCAIVLVPGQRHVFAPGPDGLVNLCSRYDATPGLLARLRAARRPLP